MHTFIDGTYIGSMITCGPRQTHPGFPAPIITAAVSVRARKKNNYYSQIFGFLYLKHQQLYS